MQDEVSFGRWLQLRRKALKLSQSELAQQVGVAANTIHKFEVDARRPSKEAAQRLAKVLKVPPTHHTLFVKVARGERTSDWLADLEQKPPVAQGSHAQSLPAQLTPFIGRPQQIAMIHLRLREPQVRLVTLTGPGGTGKTRLALQATAEMQEEYANGVWFVDLSSVRATVDVASAIAATLGVMEVGQTQLLESLKASLQEKHALMILDNFEQVVAAAPLITELLSAAPRLQVLVTSRMVLGVYGEHNVAVPPLMLPELTDVLTLEQLTAFEAVALFTQRARAANSDFSVTDETVPAIVEICRRLDGLPLAIELAAAYVRLFAPQALLRRLANSLRLLASGARDVPARQQTLQATIDWSYALLDADERRLCTRLAVFAGGCTLEAAATVCGDDLPFPMLSGLLALVDKNLLQPVSDVAGEPRFTMLQTLHEYAYERLADSGEQDLLQRRHATMFLALAETAPDMDATLVAKQWLDRIEQERDNFRAALTWSLRVARDAEMELRLAYALHGFWWTRGHMTEGHRWLVQGLALHFTPSVASLTLRAAALAHAAEFGILNNDPLAKDRLEESLCLHRELGNDLGVAWALWWLHFLEADDHMKKALLEESIAVFQVLGYKTGVARVLSSLASLHRKQGDLDSALTYLNDSLHLLHTTDDTLSEAYRLNELGMLMAEKGEFESASAYFQNNLPFFRNLRERLGVANTLENLCIVALAQGKYDVAQSHGEESLWLFQELGLKVDTVRTLVRLGEIAWGLGDIVKADTRFEAGLSLASTIGEANTTNFREMSAYTLLARARLAQRRGGGEVAAAMCEESLAVFRDLGNHWGTLMMLNALDSVPHLNGDTSGNRP